MNFSPPLKSLKLLSRSKVLETILIATTEVGSSWNLVDRGQGCGQTSTPTTKNDQYENVNSIKTEKTCSILSTQFKV